jgi:hypothetical protein
MNLASALLAVTALLGALIGSQMLTQATLGVGVIGVCAVLAIVGRMLQAAGNHARLMALLERDGRPDRLAA